MAVQATYHIAGKFGNKLIWQINRLRVAKIKNHLHFSFIISHVILT